MEVVYVGVDSIKPGLFNPQSRTEVHRLKELKESIIKHGFLPSFPILVGDDGRTIGDGHRRYAVARLIGLDQVPVIFTDIPAASIFAFQWGGRSNMNGRQLLESMINGVPLEEFPKAFKSFYRSIIETCGEDAIQYIAEHDTSPSIIQDIRRVLTFIRRHAPEFILDKPSAFSILKWAMSNNQIRRARFFIENGGNVDRLLNAIARNRPLPRSL